MSSAIALGVLAVGATVYSADQAGDAANAQVRGANAAGAESSRQYDQTRTDLAPYRDIGGGSLNALAQTFGLGMQATPGEFDPAGYLRDNQDVAANPFFARNPEEHYLRHGRAEGRVRNATGAREAVPAGAPDMSKFFTSPGYQFRRDEGMRDIGNSFGAEGGAYSGNALKALAEWNGQNASQEFGSWVNQLNNFAGIGQSSTNQTASYGADAANQAGRNALYAGDARASGIQDQASLVNNGINQLGGLAGYYQKPKASGVGYYDIDLGGQPRRK
jgi:hypothetical protein